MIVKMKKALLVLKKDKAPASVSSLRDLGLLHVEHQQPPAGRDIDLLKEDIALLNSALTVISQIEFNQEAQAADIAPFSDWKQLARHIIDTDKRVAQLDEYSRNLSESIQYWKNWGDFSPQEISGLREKGIIAKLYRIPEKQLETLPDDLVVKEIFTAGGMCYCLVISRSDFNLQYMEISLPKMGLSEMQQRLARDSSALRSLNSEIKSLARFRGALLKIKNGLQKGLSFQEVIKGMGYTEELAFISGYFPAEEMDALRSLVEKESWAIMVTDPAEEDNVPVLLRNAKWVELIEPLFKLMEIVPGYHELDVSPLFLLFLSLFFGMIIGDAGYGAVYFLLTFLARRKSRSRDNKAFFLFYLFSSCAIIWGLLTGVVFGRQWYLAKGFKPLVPLLNQTRFIMSFCFFLGALQLSFGHIWQAIRKLPSLQALADLGFISLLWAGFFLAKMFIVGDAFPDYGKWLIWIGVSLIIFFSYPSRNILKTIAKGLGVLALGLTGNFGDVVSYIRLFAVGLAGVAVSDSVNTLAAGAGSNIVARAAILFVGHTINIVLGPISVLVHGIRLNLLEFSVLHGNVTWSGLAYKPLKK